MRGIGGPVLTTTLVSIPPALINSAAAQSHGPDLILRDSVVLEETEEHYIGSPYAVFVAPDGSMLVVDGFVETVLRYDATGRLEGHWGGRGGAGGGGRESSRTWPKSLL